jgi:hypothetical protein
MYGFRFFVFVLGVVGLFLGWPLHQAHACGGLFCNRSQPVNQAAERIIFAENGDGTVTAVIEIKYEGPSKSFSWVLPVPGVPAVAVSSTTAFDRLQTQTDPQYMLQTSFADGCGGTTKGLAFPTSANDSATAAEHGNVTVLATGTVGPFDYEVIMVKPDLADPADVAVQWLGDNGYDVTALGPDVLRPYLQDQLNLLAFRLSKDSMTGSIRPSVITYQAQMPFIPIRPTAVAANDDMGVMVWVVGESRAIPDNYKALELNEALIDWFNPMRNYDKVVSAAADESGGQGFVTELAAKSSTLKNVVLQDFEQQEWQRISNQQYTSAVDFINDAKSALGQWDGFTDALQAAATLPLGVTIKDLSNCPACYVTDSSFAFDQAAFRKALFEKVYKPMADTEDLLGSRPYVTRLYTTMSADEMTVDPGFNFNADLGDVSNLHTAKQVIACDQSWIATLPQGDVVTGKTANTWPSNSAKQPSARKILQLATQGKGTVMVDNSQKITKLLVHAAAQQGVKVTPGPDGGTATVLQGGSSGGCTVSQPATAAHRDGPAGGFACVLLALGWLARRRRD